MSIAKGRRVDDAIVYRGIICISNVPNRDESRWLSGCALILEEFDKQNTECVLDLIAVDFE